MYIFIYSAILFALRGYTRGIDMDPRTKILSEDEETVEIVEVIENADDDYNDLDSIDDIIDLNDYIL